MRRFLPLALALTFLCTGETQAQDPPVSDLTAVLDKSFGANPLWDDGQAEVATYAASRVIYGKSREHTVTLLTVYEDFTTEFYTKADWPYGQKPIVPVIKQNFLADIPTSNYTYRYMTSTFTRRNDPGEALKLSVVATEWCGITTKEFQLWRDRPQEIYHSYWDGEGFGTRELPGDIADFFEEELFFTLRALPFSPGLEANLWLYPNQTTNRAPEPKPVDARLNVQRGNTTWIVTVETGDNRELVYKFATEYPHVLEEFTHSDGRTMKLIEVERRAYWNIEE